MKKIFILALTCTIVSLVSCDKIKEVTSTDFKVNNVHFDFSTNVEEGPSSSSADVFFRAATQTFTITRLVNISELGSDDVIEYANKISKVVIDNSLIRVTVSPAGTYTIENLTVTASGVPGSIVIPSYTMGSPFTLTSDMNTFTSAFIMKLISAKSLSVTVSGKTDAPVGTTINISYESNLIFTAGLL